MTPADALRRARATMECGERGTQRMPGCAITYLTPVLPFRLPWPLKTEHEAFASALLDGYSIAEITKAGG